MRNFYITLSAYIFFIIIILFAIPRSTATPFDETAIWNPPNEAITTMMEKCPAKMLKRRHSRCIADIMREYKASPEAIRFTQLAGGNSFMSDFLSTKGKIAVATALVIAADHNQAYYLINGKPEIIDVDAPQIIGAIDLEKNPSYQNIKKQYPNVFLMPGNHRSPKIINLNDGGQRFIYTYQLKDGCAACKSVGNAEIAFNFNSVGDFQGAYLVSVGI